MLGWGQPVLGQPLFNDRGWPREFFCPPPSAMLRLTLILPALLQPLFKGGVLHLPEWFKTPEQV